MNAGNTGDHSEKLRTSDADKDETLVNTVEERMRNLNELTNPKASDDLDEEPNPDEEQDEEEQDDQEVSEEDEEDPNSDEDKDDEVKDDDKEKDDEVKIPYALEQAAMRSGWSKEDIDDAVKANPEKAKKMFNNLYNSLNQASREFSALGRAKAKVNSTPDNKVDDGFQGVDINKLKEEYKDDPIIDGVVAPLNAALNKMMAKVSELEANTNQQPMNNAPVEDLTTKQAIDSFFNSDQMKPYEKVYGRTELGQDWSVLQGTQHSNRWNVLKEADAIMAGYAAIGQTISVDEALERAHLVVTEPIREQVIRESIKKSVKKRGKSTTMRPSKSTRTSSSSQKFDTKGKPRSKQELEQQVGEKLQNIFG